jgi:hypothetical protein
MNKHRKKWEKLHNMYTCQEVSELLHKLGVVGIYHYVWTYPFEQFRYIKDKSKPMRLIPTGGVEHETVYPAYSILELLDVLKILYKDIEPEYSKVLFYKLIDDYVGGKFFNQRLWDELKIYVKHKGE